MSISLDVHILLHPNREKEWQKQAINSVTEAANRADFPVHLHVIQGVNGHIGLGRKIGYSVGNAVYKTYVDDDDWIDPLMFCKLKPLLEENPDAVFSYEVRHFGKLIDARPYLHHLFVIKNNHTQVVDFGLYPRDTLILREWAKRANYSVLPEYLYHCRYHKDQARRSS